MSKLDKHLHPEAILLLDNQTYLLEKWQQDMNKRLEVIEGPELIVLGEHMLGGYSERERDPRNFLKSIDQVTRNGISYVVIGDNDALSLEKAAAVNAALRGESACISFKNGGVNGNAEAYRQLGFSHFVSDYLVESHIREHLFEKYSLPQK